MKGRVYFARESYETYESSSVKSARKAKGELHKACERASETRERTLCRQKTKQNVHGNKYNHMHWCAEGLAPSVPFIKQVLST